MPGLDLAIALNIGRHLGECHRHGDDQQRQQEHDGDEDVALFGGLGAAGWGG
jgi:hypothetical protein